MRCEDLFVNLEDFELPEIPRKFSFMKLYVSTAPADIIVCVYP